jgi:Flp pilus assembly protein CpaB
VELEYSDKNSKRSKLYIAVGIVIALIVGGIVFVALRFANLTETNAVEMRSVVVAVRDIASRKPIEDGDVTTRSVPADPTNVAAFTRVDEVLGRISGVSISTGQLVTRNLLASTNAGQTFSILDPGQKYDPSGPDLRAVSVTVADDHAVAGTLKAGQRVDLIVTLAMNPQLGQSSAQATKTLSQLVPGPSTKVTLQSVVILARNGSIYIVRTDLATAEKIAELTAAGGQFTMVLRSDEDDRVAKTTGSTLDSLINEFHFPYPKVPPVGTNQAAP